MLNLGNSKIYNLDDFTVLVVDDFEFVAELLVTMLEEMGIGRCLTAKSCAEAREIMSDVSAKNSRDNIDLVIICCKN